MHEKLLKHSNKNVKVLKKKNKLENAVVSRRFNVAWSDSIGRKKQRPATWILMSLDVFLDNGSAIIKKKEKHSVSSHNDQKLRGSTYHFQNL